jgi:hypothetical protein
VTWTLILRNNLRYSWQQVSTKSLTSSRHYLNFASHKIHRLITSNSRSEGTTSRIHVFYSPVPLSFSCTAYKHQINEVRESVSKVPWFSSSHSKHVFLIQCLWDLRLSSSVAYASEVSERQSVDETETERERRSWTIGRAYNPTPSAIQLLTASLGLMVVQEFEEGEEG